MREGLLSIRLVMIGGTQHFLLGFVSRKFLEMGLPNILLLTIFNTQSINFLHIKP
jgi:hypothetical protein